MALGLIVELTEQAQVALNARASKENLNKTTIVCRAVQLYALVQASRDAGYVIEIVKPNGTRDRLVQE